MDDQTRTDAPETPAEMPVTETPEEVTNPEAPEQASPEVTA